MANPPTSTPWVPIWPQADPGIPIPSPVGQDGKWLTVAGGAMVWGAPAIPTGLFTPDAAWKTIGVDIPFESGWVGYSAPYGPARFRKLASGLVVMNGLISSGTIGSTAFTMPVGYRIGPQADSSTRDTIWECATGGAVNYESARFNSGGQFIPTGANSSTWISLAQIAYYAAG